MDMFETLFIVLSAASLFVIFCVSLAGPFPAQPIVIQCCCNKTHPPKKDKKNEDDDISTWYADQQ